MAAEVRSYQVAIPAGTAIAAPQVTSLPMPARIVRHIRVRIPPGPRGNVGFALGMIGTPVIPTQAGTFIVADDEIMEWDVDNAPTSGAWQLIGYNLGGLSHTIYVQFNVDLPGAVAASGIGAPLDVTA